MAELGTAAWGDEGVDGSGDEETREADGRRGEDAEEHSFTSGGGNLVVLGGIFSSSSSGERTRERTCGLKMSVRWTSSQQ